MTGLLEPTLYCSEELTEGIISHLICLAVFNIVFSITALVGNSLIFVALQKDTSLHPPSKVLLRNLAASDCFVGLLQPLFATYLLSLVHQRWQLCVYTFIICTITASMLVEVSFLTITAISVDRLLAILLGLRYRQVVTLKRVYVVVITFWVFPVVGVVVGFYSHNAWEIFTVSKLIISLIASIYCYIRIFARLHRHGIQVQDNAQVSTNQTISLNITPYRKTVYSALWVKLALGLCYLPYLFAAPLLYPKIRMRQASGFYFFMLEAFISLTFFNSSLNPVLYCWKIKEVRRAMKDTLRELCCLRND